MDKHSETFWAIAGVNGLYTGICLTRREAIYEHVNALLVVPSDDYSAIQKGWKRLKRRGDKAVKVEITYEY